MIFAVTINTTNVGRLIYSNYSVTCIDSRFVLKLTFNKHHREPAIYVRNNTNWKYLYSSSSSSLSLARQPCVGPDLPQKLLSAKVSGYCFFRFRDKSLLQGGLVSPTPNPLLSWRADVFCQGCLP
jgi:hypothetical protein